MSTANFTTMKHFPLYTYPTEYWEMRCDDCGEYWEYDENDTACPFCGSESVSEVDSGWSRADDFFSALSLISTN